MNNVNQNIPYFRIGRDDYSPVDTNYIKDLDVIFGMIERNKWYPTLVHCLAGVHRSPAAAIYAQWRLEGRSKKSLDRIRVEARQLCSAMQETLPYHASLMTYCENWKS